MKNIMCKHISFLKCEKVSEKIQKMANLYEVVGMGCTLRFFTGEKGRGGGNKKYLEEI